MMVRILAIFVTLACAPLVTGAQQIQENVPFDQGHTPGITVVATGTVSVKDWVEELDLRYVPPMDSGKTALSACAMALSKLDATLGTLELSNALVTGTVEYEGAGAAFDPLRHTGPVAVARVHVAVDAVESLRSALAKLDWKEPGSPKLLPRDPTSADLQAYAAAVADARRRASAIAVADGRRLGRLLNVQPVPSDYLSSLMGSLATFAMNRAAGGTVSIPEVSHTASFTFELLP